LARGETERLIEMATSRWLTDAPSPNPSVDQQLWLAALSPPSGAPEMPGMSSEMSATLVAAFRCQDDAVTLLDRTTLQDRRTRAYWVARVRVAANRGTSDDDAMEALRIHAGDSAGAGLGAYGRLNPLVEGGWWGYRRHPIFWSEGLAGLPDPRAGLGRWLVAPSDAVAEAGLQEKLPQCARRP
jgi:hypothetical protein